MYDKPLGLTNDFTPTDHHLSSPFVWEFCLSAQPKIVLGILHLTQPETKLGILALAGTRDPFGNLRWRRHPCGNPARPLGGRWAGAKKTLGDRGEFLGSFLRVIREGQTKATPEKKCMK